MKDGEKGRDKDKGREYRLGFKTGKKRKTSEEDREKRHPRLEKHTRKKRVQSQTAQRQRIKEKRFRVWWVQRMRPSSPPVLHFRKVAA